MSDILTQKRLHQYNLVNDLFINGLMSIDDACKKAKIGKTTYYRIKKNISNQKGGDKIIKNEVIIDNEPNNNIKQAETGSEYSKLKAFIKAGSKERQLQRKITNSK
jgi:hypothetical protein